MRLFGYLSEAYDKIKKNELSPEDRDRAMRYILSHPSYCLYVLKDRLFRGEVEKKRLIHKAIRDSGSAFSLLMECLMLLDRDEIQVAIKVAMESPGMAHQLLRDFAGISEDQRILALENVLLERDTTLKFLKDPNTSVRDRVYILEQLPEYSEIWTTYIEHHKNTAENADDARKLAFRLMVTRGMKEQLFRLAVSRVLYPDELKELYGLYRKDYYDKTKKSFYRYFDYCSTWNQWLSDAERERMARKIMTKSYWSHHLKVCRNVDFSDEVKERIQAYEMVEKLRKTG